MATCMNYEQIGKWFCDKYKWKNPKCSIVSNPTSFTVYFVWQYMDWNECVYIKKDVMDMYEIAQKDLESKIVY